MVKLFDATEVANFFKVKLETIYQWNFYKKIKSVKVNGRLLFKLEDIMNMVAQEVFYGNFLQTRYKEMGCTNS